MVNLFEQRGGGITAQLVSSCFTGMNVTKQDNMLLFLCSKVIESKPVKLESNSTVILPPAVSIF